MRSLHGLKRTLIFSLSIFGHNLLVSESQAQRCDAPTGMQCFRLGSSEVDTKDFGEEVARALHRMTFKGFSLSVVGRNGRGILEITSGYRNDSKDTFDRLTPSCIGSVSKMITEMALLKSLEITEIADKYSKCRRSVNSKAIELLPEIFHRITHPDYQRSDINNFLDHNSGLSKCADIGKDGQDGHNRWDYVKLLSSAIGEHADKCDKGVAECGKPVPGGYCYNNNNYVIAAMLLPLIRGGCSGKKREIEARSAVQCMFTPEGRRRDDCLVNHSIKMLSEEANDIVREMVWRSTTAMHNAFCKPLANLQGGPAQWFLDPTNENEKGQYRSPGEKEILPQGCGVGGWYTSSTTLARLLSKAWYGNFFLQEQLTVKQLPPAHTGLRDGYHSLAFKLGRGLSVAFLSNSPFDFVEVGDAIIQAYEHHKYAKVKVGSSTLFRSRVRGISWKCHSRDPGQPGFELRFSEWDQPKGLFKNEWNGYGAEEVWYVSKETKDRINGSYSYHQLGTSQLSDSARQGEFTAEIRDDSGTDESLLVWRRDLGSGWEGRYECEKYLISPSRLAMKSDPLRDLRTAKARQTEG